MQRTDWRTRNAAGTFLHIIHHGTWIKVENNCLKRGREELPYLTKHKNDYVPLCSGQHRCSCKNIHLNETSHLHQQVVFILRRKQTWYEGQSLTMKHILETLVVHRKEKRAVRKRWLLQHTVRSSKRWQASQKKLMSSVSDYWRERTTSGAERWTELWHRIRKLKVDAYPPWSPGGKKKVPDSKRSCCLTVTLCTNS